MTRFLAEVVDNLEDVLRSHGFVRCDIPACNCGSWHPRYGLYERWQEIKDALTDAEVLNNETGNLPLRAVKLLIEQRDALRADLAARGLSTTPYGIRAKRIEELK